MKKKQTEILFSLLDQSPQGLATWELSQKMHIPRGAIHRLVYLINSVNKPPIIASRRDGLGKIYYLEIADDTVSE